MVTDIAEPIKQTFIGLLSSEETHNKLSTTDKTGNLQLVFRKRTGPNANTAIPVQEEQAAAC